MCHWNELSNLCKCIWPFPWQNNMQTQWNPSEKTCCKGWYKALVILLRDTLIHIKPQRTTENTAFDRKVQTLGLEQQMFRGLPSIMFHFGTVFSHGRKITLLDMVTFQKNNFYLALTTMNWLIKVVWFSLVSFWHFWTKQREMLFTPIHLKLNPMTSSLTNRQKCFNICHTIPCHQSYASNDFGKHYGVTDS